LGFQEKSKEFQREVQALIQKSQSNPRIVENWEKKEVLVTQDKMIMVLWLKRESKVL